MEGGGPTYNILPMLVNALPFNLLIIVIGHKFVCGSLKRKPDRSCRRNDIYVVICHLLYPHINSEKR